MPAMAVSNQRDESAPSWLFKLHSAVFVCLTARAGGAKIPYGSILEPEGPTRAHAKSKIVEWNLTSPLCLSIPVRTSQALERVQRTTDGPSTPLALPRCAYGTARCGHTTRPRTTRSTRARRFLAPTCRRVIDGTPRRPRRPSSRPPRSRSARGRRRGL